MSAGHVEPKKLWSGQAVANSATTRSGWLILADCSRFSLDLTWTAALSGTLTLETTNDPHVRDSPADVAGVKAETLAPPAQPNGALVGTMWHISELNCLAVRVKFVAGGSGAGTITSCYAHAKT